MELRFRQVHLDFHTSEKIPGIGKKFSKEQFQEALKTGHVDSITVFSKCHHGWAYHPSEANEMHPGLDFDLLGAQIEAAHEIGVKTPVYLSAGLDEKMARRRPEWLVRGKDESTVGVPDFARPGYHKFCLNSPYLDYLLAQVKEVCERYDADGIFLDIVGVQPCYCQNCVGQLIAEGKDPYDEENILELAERVYANYCRRVRETIDSVKPGLPVFHNGGHIRRGKREFAHFNTHLELESLPTGGWGYDHFPLSARYAQTLGMEFLGMTGKFHLSWGEFGGFKHKNALRYEAALSASNGAKCSVGDQLAPNGEMDMATYRLIGAAYAELEEKEPWLRHVRPVADVALLSAEAADTSFGTVQSPETAQHDTGAVRMLLEGHYLFNVVDMEEDLSAYKVVVLPDTITITQPLQEKLTAFVRAGGKILATGKSGLDADGKNFCFDLGADYVGPNPYQPDYFRPAFVPKDMDISAYVFYSQGEKITARPGAKVHGERENPYFNRTWEHFSSHQHAPNSGESGGPGMTEGKDGIYIAWQVFADYAKAGSLILKRTVCHALDILLGGNKTLETSLPAQGVSTFMDQAEEKRLVCHLLYASPVKRGDGVEIIEDILPVRDIEVAVRPGKIIRRVTLAPQGTEIPFTEEEGQIRFTLPELSCHQMLVLDYE